MGNPDVVVIINNWFAIIVKGEEYEKETDVVLVALEKYEQYKDTIINAGHPDPSFEWEITGITITNIIKW